MWFPRQISAEPKSDQSGVGKGYGKQRLDALY